MTDDDLDDVYGDTDPNNLPDDDDGGSGQEAAAPAAPSPPTSAGDGLPGFPVQGMPGRRAGVFGSGAGLLGMARVSDLAAPSANGPPATLQLASDQGPAAGQGDARPQPASNPVLDYEQNSWRWNDPAALAYDLDRKKRQLAQAQALSGGSNAADWGQLAAAGALRLGSVPVGAANGALGQYMSNVETPMLQQVIQAIQARLSQLQRRPKT